MVSNRYSVKPEEQYVYIYICETGTYHNIICAFNFNPWTSQLSLPGLQISHVGFVAVGHVFLNASARYDKGSPIYLLCFWQIIYWPLQRLDVCYRFDRQDATPRFLHQNTVCRLEVCLKHPETIYVDVCCCMCLRKIQDQSCGKCPQKHPNWVSFTDFTIHWFELSNQSWSIPQPSTTRCDQWGYHDLAGPMIQL